MGNTEQLEYVGFWARVGASIIDTILILLITAPITIAIYGQFSASMHGPMIRGPGDLLINYILPAVLVIGLWIKYGATPGKMALSAKIVDATTGHAPTPTQLVIRYLGYFVSLIPFGLGIFWVGFDRRKQGWHDKMANTVVIRPKGPTAVKFADTAPMAQRREPGI